MAEAIDNPRAVLGDNSLSFLDFYREQNEGLPAYLAAQRADLVNQSSVLKEDFEALPGAIETDDQERTMVDMGGRLSKFIKANEAQRKADKAPVQQAVRIVDDFYGALANRVEPCLSAASRRVTSYNDQKRAAAAKERQEQERRAREAAEEAERAAENVRRLAREKEEAERAADEPVVDHEFVEQQRAAEQEAEHAAAIARDAARTAAAPPVVAPVVRSESGTKSMQRMVWTGDIVDLEALDLNALRPYISVAALETAVRQYAVKNKDAKPLAGARLYEKSSTSFR